MQKRMLGGLKTPISAIGLGCMGMSEFYGPTDDAQSQSVMTRALQLGTRQSQSDTQRFLQRAAAL